MRLTTFLDLLGCLALVVGAALFVAQWSLPGAVALFGAGILVLSWLIDRKGKR